jgi:hypothetical protein
LTKTFPRIYPITNILLSDFHNKELIPLRFDEDKGTVTLEWTAKDFLTGIGPNIDSKFNAWINKFNN